MKKFIVSIDQGTTSTRAILFNLSGVSVYLSQKEFTQYFPNKNWVEHDPIEIWETQLKSIKEVIKKADVSGTLAASVFHKELIGITQLKQYLIKQDIEVRI